MNDVPGVEYNLVFYLALMLYDLSVSNHNNNYINILNELFKLQVLPRRYLLFYVWIINLNSNGQMSFHNFQHLQCRADSIYLDLDIVTMEDTFEEVDAIVVTAVTFYEEIAEKLEKKLKCPILSLEDILYEA